MARLSVWTGTEGPKHDPYGVLQMTFVRTDGLSMVFRQGMLLRTEPETSREGVTFEQYELNCIANFEQFCGVSIKTLSRLAEKELAQMYNDPMGCAADYE